MRAAIFDLDGTICNIDHRLHHVVNGGHNWDAFFAGIPDDLPNLPIVDALRAFQNDGVAIVLCSGRPEKCRLPTEEWLHRFGIRYNALYMRPNNDSRPDHVVKRQILQDIRAYGYEPFIVIDDRQSVVEMWREEKLTCLQCAPSDREIPSTAILTLMVGPSGAGKSTWLGHPVAWKEFDIRPGHIVSSDAVREDLCGNFRDQSKNEQVFAAVHAVARARLRNGLPVVIDATHLRRRDRMASAALAEGKCLVRYIVLDRPLEIKRQHGGWRNDIMKDGEPFDLIGKHNATFLSQIKEILRGDGLPNVEVHDFRNYEMRSTA